MIGYLGHKLISGLTYPFHHYLGPTLGFHPECQYYLENIFKEVGGPFDLRLMLYQCNEDDIKTTHMSIETLNFNKGLFHFAFLL